MSSTRKTKAARADLLERLAQAGREHSDATVIFHATLGNRLGKKFVTVVGCGLPIAAFALAVKCFLDLRAAGYAPLVDVAYTWLVAGQARFEVVILGRLVGAVVGGFRHGGNP